MGINENTVFMWRSLEKNGRALSFENMSFHKLYDSLSEVSFQANKRSTKLPGLSKVDATHNSCTQAVPLYTQERYIQTPKI